MNRPCRREPERTCIACRVPAGKPELVRLVRAPSGGVSIDLTGRAPGRGAYLHRSASCIHRAATAKSLRRALKVPLSDQEAARLIAALEELGETI